MKNMRRSNGVQEVAKAFEVSIRTVQREMKKIRRVKKLGLDCFVAAAPRNDKSEVARIIK